jgi:chemotaxis protein histidine kinase CheA
MLGEVGPYWTILVGAVLIWVAADMLGLARCSMSGSLLARIKIKGLLGAFILGLAYGVLSGSCTFGFIAPILAIITVLMVEVAGAVYALPSGAVVESLRFPRSEVTRINGRDTLRVRDRLVPLLHLAELFGAKAAGGDSAYAVIVGRGEKRLGLTVDRLRGQQDVVIKALDPVVAEAVVGIAGATILGDGRVVLILDVASLFEGRRLRARGRQSAEA